MDKYFMWIHYERLHNHNKAKHNKTVCIFLGIYCIRGHAVNSAECMSLKYICIWGNQTDYLTQWGRDKMDAISQTTFWSTFSWMKRFEFRLKFHWSLFLKVQLTIFQNWFRKWLGAVQTTSHYLNQWWLFYGRIYASLGLNDLNFYHFTRLCIQFVSKQKLMFYVDVPDNTAPNIRFVSSLYFSYTYPI